jgi:hypothetical protein
MNPRLDLGADLIARPWAVVRYFDCAQLDEQFYTDAGRSTSASFPEHGGCHARFTTLPR